MTGRPRSCDDRSSVSEHPLYERIKSFTENRLPFNRLLGIELVHLARGTARIAVAFRDDLLGEPQRSALHGGVIATMLDVAASVAVFSMLETENDAFSTIDLRVDYLRPGQHETLVAEAMVSRAGRRIAFVDAAAFHPGLAEQPIATGKCVIGIHRSHRVPGDGK